MDNLPKSLKNLTLSNCGSFKKPLEHLPEKLESLSLHDADYKNKLNKLPNITSLYLHISAYEQCLNELPNSIKSLTLNYGQLGNKLTKLPDSLEQLKFISSGPFLRNVLPNIDILNLITLKYGKPFDQLPIDNYSLVVNRKDYCNKLTNTQPLTLIFYRK